MTGHDDMQRIELGAGPLHYRDLGPRSGPVLVLTHGFLVDATLWGEVPDRLAGAGFRVVVPTLPLGSHPEPMRPGADLSPRGVARLVLELVSALGLDDVVLVGNDSGGAICQFLLDEDPAPVRALVLTDCDAFDVFPPFPFNAMFRAFAHPHVFLPALSALRSARVRRSSLAFGGLVRRRLADQETRRWVAPYLRDADVRRDTARFVAAVRPAELADVATRLRRFERPVLLCWAPDDPYFRIGLGRRLAAAFPDARLVEVPGARTFVPLDEPARLAEEITCFVRGLAAGPVRAGTGLPDACPARLGSWSWS